MQKWIVEDWEFELTATEGKAGHCRLGLEKGDRFVFQYGCPAGICPRVMTQLYTWREVLTYGGDFTYSKASAKHLLRNKNSVGVRRSGDYTYRASKEKYELDLSCPCGCIQFHLKAYPVNRDENGKPQPNNPRPED
jgi:uncharacterized repeat protein (TIGR04076 family)